MLLVLLFLIWLVPDWFGLPSSRPIRKADGATVVVRDGDTLKIGGQDYRLHGIDAPEFTQVCKTGTGTDWLCGKEAREALVKLVGTNALECEERAKDKYNRVVATCRTTSGIDLAQKMAEAGMAVSFGGFAEGPYAAEEAEAQTAKRGLWQGAFDPPSSWRTTHPRTPVASRSQWIWRFSGGMGVANLANLVNLAPRGSDTRYGLRPHLLRRHRPASCRGPLPRVHRHPAQQGRLSQCALLCRA
jgi:endonuclease YncB( thermonuclease family)